MSEEPVAGLETLRSLQARFLNAVSEGRWDDAVVLHRDRFRLMDLLLNEKMTPVMVIELQAILAMDQDVMPDIERARTAIGDQLRDLIGTRKALGAYLAR